MHIAKRVGVAAVLFGAGTAVGQVFPRQGIELLAWRDLGAFNTPGPAPSSGNDCWGYVSPSGREYALIVLRDRLGVVEVTDPVNPVILTPQITHSNSLWGDVKVYGHYAYISNETGGGLQVVDLANVDSGQVTLVRNVTGNGMNSAHNVALNPQTPFVYVVGSSVSGSGGAIVAFSLADPSNPVYAGTWSGPYVHDAQVVSYTTGPYAGREIAFCCCESNGVYVVDVTNKAAMVTLGQTTYPGVQYCHQAWLSEDRNFLYVDDELDGPAQGVPSSFTRIIDVSNLTQPTYVGGFASGASGSTDHNLYVRGRYIFAANYHSGLRVFDTQGQGTPTAPVEVAYLDTYPENDGTGYDGAWSTYPFFPSGTVIVSDINRGLFVARLALDYLTVSYPNGQPARLQPGARTPITAQVVTSPGGSAVDPASVSLHFRIGAGEFQSVPMTALGGDLFTANLPAASCLETVSYYVSAANSLGAVYTNPQGGAGSPASSPVYAGQVSILADDMEIDRGWTTGLAGDTATSGVWQRGNPEATIAQPEDDHTAAPGVNCWVTGRTRGSGDGANDVDGGFTTLLSPTMNLSGTPDARMGYWRWYSNAAGGAPNADTFRVGISNDNGANWSVAETVGPGGAETSGGWIYHEFRVADLITPTAQMRIRFVADDAATGSLIEACVDDFSAFSFDCTNVCPSLSQHPAAATHANEGDTVQLTVAASAPGTLTYAWRRNNVPLVNGGSISGATTAQVTITGVSASDAGEYDCLVGAACGTILSNAGTLTVAPACDPDVNCDGVPDQGDVACMILAVAGDMGCFCQADPDFNGDGVPDQGDVADVILSVAGAPCP